MIPSSLPPEKTSFAIAGVMAIGANNKPTCASERLFVDGIEVTPIESLAISNHSPSGFAWGYSGRGADQTALALCLFIFRNADVAKAIYQPFKVTFVQQWPLARPFNEEIDITDLLLDHWSTVSEAYALSHNHTDIYETRSPVFRK